MIVYTHIYIYFTFENNVYIKKILQICLSTDGKTR